MGYIAYHEMQIRIWATADSADAALVRAEAEMAQCGEDDDRIREVEVMPATDRLIEWVERNGGDESSVGWEAHVDADGLTYADLSDVDDCWG